MDRMIQQLINRFLGRLMNRVIGSGINYVANRGKSPSEMTEAERAQTRNGRDLAKKARKMSRASRKLF